MKEEIKQTKITHIYRNEKKENIEINIVVSSSN